MGVSVGGESPAAGRADKVVDGFPLYQIQMVIPPAGTTGIRAEFLLLASGVLFHRLAALSADSVFYKAYRRSFLLDYICWRCFTRRKFAEMGFNGVDGDARLRCDTLIAKPLGVETFHDCFLFIGHCSFLQSWEGLKCYPSSWTWEKETPPVVAGTFSNMCRKKTNPKNEKKPPAENKAPASVIIGLSLIFELKSARDDITVLP